MLAMNRQLTEPTSWDKVTYTLSTTKILMYQSEWRRGRKFWIQGYEQTLRFGYELDNSRRILNICESFISLYHGGVDCIGSVKD